MVNKLASGLTKLDFGKGDVICMFCSNYVDYWLIALAAWLVEVLPAANLVKGATNSKFFMGFRPG